MYIFLALVAKIAQTIPFYRTKCSIEWNRFGNFGRGSYEEHLCEKYFETESAVQEMPFKVFFNFISGGHFVW